MSEPRQENRPVDRDTGGEAAETAHPTGTGAEGGTDAPAEAGAESAEHGAGTGTGTESETGTGTEIGTDGEPRPAGRGRDVLLTALAVVLVLGAAGGGLAYTKATVDAADRSAPTTIWRQPEKNPSEDDPAPDLSRGRTDGELRKKLLPVPENFRLGPDIAEFGNDVELSGGHAQALMEMDGDDLPSRERRAYLKRVAELRIQGVVMRTYTSADNDLLVRIQIARMENEKGLRDLSRFRSGMADALSVFRDGPRIKGHENARCFLTPEDEESDLESMYCTAYRENLLVSFHADGLKPFRKNDAAELLKDQLDHLESPGEYI
ncbi:hypothetical protein [Streptomyces taklimakanensis]|uniref:hypothetical protein n=1 Tax=Streptomyces taklimakanensis TaxID=2569853 RepID=UPI00192E428E|nr:hypothetical protein [Streptomyces taklimakanensis]